MKKAIAAAFGGWAKGPAAVINMPKVKPQHVLDLTDRPDAAQSTLLVGMPVPDRDQPGCDSAGGDQCAAGRLVRFAHHFQHSRAERLHLFAKQPGFAPLSRCVLGGNCGRNDAIHRTSLKEIFGEIDRLAKEAAGDAELKGIQSYLSGLVRDSEFVARRADRQLRFVDFQGLGEDYLKNLRAESERGDAGRSAENDARIHQAGPNDDRGGRRQSQDCGAACAVYPAQSSSRRQLNYAS